MLNLGLHEMLSDGLVLVEWPDRAERVLPLPRYRIQIEITGRRRRRFAFIRVE